MVLGVRLTPNLKDLITKVANSEEMDASEWVRKLIVDELKKRGAFPTLLPPIDLIGEKQTE
jgi:hypothetical protein